VPIHCFFVSSFISQLNLDSRLETPTIKLINNYMSKARSSGKNTRGISAAALYTICLEKNIRKTQKEIAQVAQVTETTLRKRYNEILEKRGLGDSIIFSYLPSG